MTTSTTQYEGLMTSDVRVQLTDLVRIVATANLANRRDMKKILGVSIELLDNAQRYSTGGNVCFSWELGEDRLVISIENKASSVDAHRLLSSVAQVNSMDLQQIADAFRAQLTNGEFGQKGGAGLGLLDIARKALGLIEASIRVAPDQNFFCQSRISIKFN